MSPLGPLNILLSVFGPHRPFNLSPLNTGLQSCGRIGTRNCSKQRKPKTCFFFNCNKAKAGNDSFRYLPISLHSSIEVAGSARTLNNGPKICCLSTNQMSEEKCVRNKELLSTCMDAKTNKKRNSWGSINYQLQRLSKGRK
ncbi:hypothetical protein LWI28_020653 [Acer negundo]|uniref:Uncharacterized protein n=1 Tax=Acer negundo TaxID=4023 RepID=A0AAD5JM18_ACENE|nr:hypothetical protein LWI28_020653 [Acer negundo]